MSSQRRLQKKNSRQSPLPTSKDIFSPRPFDSGRPARDGRLPETNILQSRPFAPRVQKSAPVQPNSVEEIEATQQFGYKALSLKAFAPSEQLQSDGKEEAAVEIGEEESGWGLGASSKQPTGVSPQEETIQQLCDECAAEEKEETEEEKATETIQAKVEEGIEQAKGSGESLDLSVRQPMESGFGADFSGVKVHTDSTSDKLNKSIQAKAFTTGKDIFFKKGEYQPHSKEGQELIAHELTHVVQQTGGIQRKSQIASNLAQINRDSKIQHTPNGIPPKKKTTKIDKKDGKIATSGETIATGVNPVQCETEKVSQNQNRDELNPQIKVQTKQPVQIQNNKERWVYRT